MAKKFLTVPRPWPLHEFILFIPAWAARAVLAARAARAACEAWVALGTFHCHCHSHSHSHCHSLLTHYYMRAALAS